MERSISQILLIKRTWSWQNCHLVFYPVVYGKLYCSNHPLDSNTDGAAQPLIIWVPAFELCKSNVKPFVECNVKLCEVLLLNF